MPAGFDDPLNPDPRKDQQAYGGFAGRQEVRDNNGAVIQQGQASGAQAAANRYQSMGALASQRQAYQGDYGAYGGAMGQSQQARGSQMDALNLQKQAAYGNAPSQAQLLGQNMIDQSLQAQMAGAAGAKGGSLAQAVALRNASNGAAAFQQQGINQLSAMKANETAVARDAYMGGSTASRNSDFAGASLELQKVGQQQQSELAQRGMNDTYQLTSEGMGQRANMAQLDAATRQSQIESSNWQKQGDWNKDATDDWWNRAAAIVGGGVKTGAGLLTDPSDEQTKYIAGPVDSIDNRYDNHIASLSAPEEPSHEEMVDRIRNGPNEKPSLSDVKQIRGDYGTSTDDALDARYGQIAHPPAPWLDEHMRDRADGEKASLGALGAPQGYADSRKGQAGYMFGGAPEAVSGYAKSDYRNDAPGTGDYVRAMGEYTNDKPGIGEYVHEMSGPGKPLDGAVVQGFPRPGPEPPERPAQEPGVPAKKERSFTQLLGALLSGVPPMKSDANTKDALGFDSYDTAFLKGNVLANIDKENDGIAKSLSGPGRNGMTSDRTAKIEKATAPMAQASRSMAGSVYKYKPEFTPPEQEEGETNVGPIAQNMARDPVAQTAISRDPHSGMLQIEIPKALKLSMAAIASLQAQNDAMRADLETLMKKGGRRG